MSRAACAALALAALCLGGARQAAAQDEFSSVPDYVELKVHLDRDAYHAGDVARVAVEMRIHPTVHVNSDRPAADYQFPTSLKWDDIPKGVTPGAISWPKAKLQAFAFTDGEKIAVLDGRQTARLDLALANDLAPGELVVLGTFKAQGCTNTICYAPQSDEVKVTLRIAPATEAVTEAGSDPILRGPEAGSDPVPAPPATATVGPDGETAADKDCAEARAATRLSDKPVALVFLGAFVAGLALTLTPCILPLVPVTIGYFASQDQSRGRPIGKAILYVMGLALVYSALGTMAALTGGLFGAMLQEPLVLIAIAALLLALALSMFGVWNMQLPPSIASRIGGGRAGNAGAFGMGAAMGLVAAPCVGPFVVSLLTYVAELGSRVPRLQAVALGGGLFFVLALGLGLPFFLVGIGVATLKPGAWMVSVKQFFGFVILVAVLWFLRPLFGAVPVFEVGLVLVAAVAAWHFLFRAPRTAGDALHGNGLRLVGAASLAVALGAAALFGPGLVRSHGTDGGFAPFSDAALVSAKAEAKPVVIDFTADWCAACKELEARTFPAPPVRTRLEDFVTLRADMTDGEDAAVRDLGRRYSVVGLPTIVFVGPDGVEHAALRLTGYEPPAAFADRLDCAKRTASGS